MWHRIDDPANPPPRDGTRVLVFKEGQVAAANWDGDWAEWTPTKSTIFRAPTHWMPLPPPTAGHETR